MYDRKMRWINNLLKKQQLWINWARFEKRPQGAKKATEIYPRNNSLNIITILYHHLLNMIIWFIFFLLTAKLSFLGENLIKTT